MNLNWLWEPGGVRYGDKQPYTQGRLLELEAYLRLASSGVSARVLPFHGLLVTSSKYFLSGECRRGMLPGPF